MQMPHYSEQIDPYASILRLVFPFALLAFHLQISSTSTDKITTLATIEVLLIKLLRLNQEKSGVKFLFAATLIFSNS